MKTALIIYKGNHYIKQINTELDYFRYALELRDTILCGISVEQFLKNAYINNDAQPTDFSYAYRIEDYLTYFYEYAFDIWECANDYKIYKDDTLEMLKNMPYTEIDGVKYY